MKKIIVLCLVVFFASVSFGFTEQLPSYKTLCKKLRDLSGWQAKKCEGINMSGSAMGAMVSAHRSYSKGNQRVEATIICGTQAMGYWAPFVYNIQAENDEGFIKVTDIDGYKVGISYHKQDKSGSIVVKLTGGGQAIASVFVLNFENMSWQEALEVAKEFDWKAMEGL